MRITRIEPDDWLVCSLSAAETGEPLTGALARRAGAVPAGIRVELGAVEVLDAAAFAKVTAARAIAAEVGCHFEILNGADAGVPVAGLVADDAPAQAWGTGWPALGLVRYGAASEAQVVQGLDVPWRGFFERSDDGVPGIGRRCLEAVRHGGVALSVRTDSAYALDLPKLFETAVRQRELLEEGDNTDLIWLCLAEAVSNAIIHGNLGIASGIRATREGFALFRQIMNERLADPVCAGRRVEISLQPSRTQVNIAVADNGNGFDFAAQMAKEENAGNKQGRGLSLMRKVARGLHAEDGGRVVVMEFPRAETF